MTSNASQANAISTTVSTARNTNRLSTNEASIRAHHRRRHEPLEELAAARGGDREADRPHAGAHDAHPEQPRNRPNRCSATQRLTRAARRRRRRRAAGRALQRRVDGEPRRLALGARRSKRYDRRRPGNHHDRRRAVAHARARRHPARSREREASVAVRAPPSHARCPALGDADNEAALAPRAERHAERARHEDRERETTRRVLRARAGTRGAHERSSISGVGQLEFEIGPLGFIATTCSLIRRCRPSA